MELHRSLFKLVLIACIGSAALLPNHAKAETNTDTNVKDLNQLHRSNQTMHKKRLEILSPSPSTYRHRLGTFQLQSRSTLRFSRDGVDNPHQNTALWQQDAQEQSHLELGSERGQIRFWQDQNKAYIAYGTGTPRYKHRQKFNPQPWYRVATNSLGDVFNLFEANLLWRYVGEQTLRGRSSHRYTLHLQANNKPISPLEQAKTHTDSTTPTALDLSQHDPSIRPSALWRSQIHPLDALGEIWIDAKTGLITEANLEGLLEVRDRPIRPTQLRVSMHFSIDKIGKMDALEMPKAIKEWQRRDKPLDLLAFFPRPPTEPTEEPQTKDAQTENSPTKNNPQ